MSRASVVKQIPFETWSIHVAPRVSSDLPIIRQDRNAEGLRLAANRFHFLKDGQPWLPVMGEFHYCRYPNAWWEEELRKMRAGGVEIVAAYVLWNHHERQPGQWDWSGDADLRTFVECARKAGLFVWLRIGPYANAEAGNRGGGYNVHKGDLLIHGRSRPESGGPWRKAMYRRTGRRPLGTPADPPAPRAGGSDCPAGFAGRWACWRGCWR
jgi:hypothetical protein